MMPRYALVLVALSLGLAPVSSAAGEPAGLHLQVLEMLEAGLSEEIVLTWLEGVEPPVARPEPAELIALKKAGAGDRLLKTLIDLSQGEGTRATEPTPAAELEPVRGVDPSPPAAAPRGRSRAADEASAERPPADADAPGVLVDFRLAYRPPKVDFDDELWDLYVYLDGVPLAYVPPTSSPLDRQAALEFRQSLTPGRHMIRVTQERHERQRKNRWRHQARVSEQEFAFELAGGATASVSLDYDEGFLSTQSDGPVSFRVLQGDRVTELERVGGNPESWAPVCEEVEAGLDGRTSPSGAEHALEGCVRWASLWGDASVPSRDSVRRAMERFDFRPVPKGS